jgi:FixJ family two-component response regulator
MTTMSTGNVGREPYTVSSALAARSIEVVAMTDVTSIVFVVDDDVSVRESLELLFRTAGWQPETFPSAREFLSRPRATVPCCLVLDVALPGLNGLELQQQLAERTDMPIIFITGHGDVPMTVQAMKAGAVEFLTKPFRNDVLLDAIRGAIERSRAALRQDAERRVLRDCYASLTPREREVMGLVVSGLLNKQVGGDGVGGAVLVGDYLYGAERGQQLLAIEFITGTVKWKAENVGWGSVAYADGHLYLHNQNGDVVLVEATQEEYRDSLRRIRRRINRRGSIRRGRLRIR